MIECISKVDNNYFGNTICIGEATRFVKNKYTNHVVALCSKCYDKVVNSPIHSSVIEITQEKYEAYLVLK